MQGDDVSGTVMLTSSAEPGDAERLCDDVVTFTSGSSCSSAGLCRLVLDGERLEI